MNPVAIDHYFCSGVDAFASDYVADPDCSGVQKHQVRLVRLGISPALWPSWSALRACHAFGQVKPVRAGGFDLDFIRGP